MTCRSGFRPPGVVADLESPSLLSAVETRSVRKEGRIESIDYGIVLRGLKGPAK